MSATKRVRVPMAVWQILLAVSLLLLWQTGVSQGWMDKFFFSRPSDVAARV